VHRRVLACLVSWVLGLLAVLDNRLAAAGQGEIMLRARVTALTPEVPVRIHWRWGGEGLGGRPVVGELTAIAPDTPKAPKVQIEGAGEEAEADVANDEILNPAPTDRVIVEGKALNYHYLKLGTWSPAVPLSTFGRHRWQLILTVTLEPLKADRPLKDCELEVELSYAGRVIKQFKVAGPDGPTFGVVLPYGRLDKDGGPTPEFIQEAGSLRDYVERKVAALLAQPWSKVSGPRRFAIVTDCAGYGEGAGYGIRTTDRETMLAEYECLRLMGVNGTVSAPGFLMEMMRRGDSRALHFARAKFVHTIGYPIPTVKYADGRPPIVHPGDGCPFHPDNIKAIPKMVQEAVERVLADVRGLPFEEVYALTVDEIGTVFDAAPEGKAHQGCCPYCQEAFRAMIRADGRKLEDFGAPDWSDIRSTYGYWGRSYWDVKQEREKGLAEARNAMEGDLQKRLEEDAAKTPSAVKPEPDSDDDVVDELAPDEAKPKRDAAKELLAAHGKMQELVWNHRAGQVSPEGAKPRLSPEGWTLLGYYSCRFNNEAAAGLFEPLQKAFAAANERKRQAAPGSPEAKQPWIYSYALRGNTFLMGGHSLDFFDFYRYADNAFIYETSNRDARVWQWDSYLCDVGRSLRRFMGKRFGIYVKPHRGAPVQRSLTAAARGVRVIYYYTYGPEWAKGDTFGGNVDMLAKIGWTTRLLAQAEDVIYDADWAVPAQVAIVRPITAKFFSNSASWENGKWVYTALMHAHIPTDPLDEGLLLTEDLSRYKVIVISGDHLRRDVARKLRTWVETGGTLYTTGWGIARDESGRPLDDILLPVFGLQKKGEMELWGDVPRYGATALGAVRQTRKPPEGATITGKAPLQGSFTAVVGRQVLYPAGGTDVLATWGDGAAAVTRHRFGRGTAWMVGMYAGVEYAWETMCNRPFSDEKRSYIAAPVLEAGVLPVVDASVPMIEGVLLRNEKSGKLAAVLINWLFKVDQPITVHLRGTGAATKARSLALGQVFTLTTADGWATLTLPRMDEGDILLLE